MGKNITVEHIWGIQTNKQFFNPEEVHQIATSCIITTSAYSYHFRFPYVVTDFRTVGFEKSLSGKVQHRSAVKAMEH